MMKTTTTNKETNKSMRTTRMMKMMKRVVIVVAAEGATAVTAPITVLRRQMTSVPGIEAAIEAGILLWAVAPTEASGAAGTPTTTAGQAHSSTE